MSLFGSARDISMFRRVNKELINKIIDTSIYYYERIETAVANIYGETTGDDTFYKALIIPAVIEIDMSEWENNNGIQDNTRAGKVTFLRDTLKDQFNVYPQVGDVIGWEGVFWEISAVVDDNTYTNKGEFWEGGSDHGQLWSITCQVHKMRKELSKLVER